MPVRKSKPVQAAHATGKPAPKAPPKQAVRVLPMPRPVEVAKPDPTAEEVLEMIQLELILTFSAIFEDKRDAGRVIAKRLGLTYLTSRNIIKQAVDMGCERGVLDVFPRKHSTYQKVMLCEVPTSNKVEKLRARYGWLAAGRKWPPPISQG